MGKSRINRIDNVIDIVIVLMQITYGLCIVQALTLSKLHIPIYLDLITLTIAAYIYRFKHTPTIIKSHKWIIVIFFSTYIFDVLQNLTIDFVHAIVRLFFFVNILLFVEYICGMYYYSDGYKKDLKYITTPLVYFSLYNVIAIFLSIILLILGSISIDDNILSDNILIHDNYIKGQTYSFPGYLSLVLHSSSRALISFGIPALSGLMHEPHVLFYLIGSGFFLILDRCQSVKYTVTLLALFLIALIASSSTTAVFVFSLCLLLDLIWNTIVYKRISLLVPYLLLAIVVFLFIDSLFGEIAESMFNLFYSKFEGEGESSKEASSSMINYVLSPSGIVGMGNMPKGDYDYHLDKMNIGLLTSLLDFSLFLSIFFVTIKNVISKNRHLHYIGMSILYYLLHNMKLAFQGFSYIYMSYMVLLCVLSLNLEKTEKKIIASNEQKE